MGHLSANKEAEMKYFSLSLILFIALVWSAQAQDSIHCFEDDGRLICISIATFTPTPTDTPTATPVPTATPTPTETPTSLPTLPPSSPLASRHPYAGVYSVWDGEVRNVNLADYPYLKGIHLYAKWSELQPTGPLGEIDCGLLITKFEQKTNGNQQTRAFLQVNAHWPDWIFDYVAISQWEKREQRIPQFWNPAYIGFYKSFIAKLGDCVSTLPFKDRIVLVRAQFNAYTPESLAPDGHFSYLDYDPPPGATPYATNFTYAIGDDYARQITQAYIDTFAPIYVVQKPFSNTGHDQTIAAEYMAMGAGLFMTNNGPSPDGRQVMRAFTQSRQIRAFSEPGTLGHCANQPADDALRFTYWSALSALHQGVEFISFYGCDVLDSRYKSIFEFVDRYAGWYREPINSPGAWIAFRDVQNPAKAWADWLPGNYEYLIHQIEPETTTGLFAYAGAGNLTKSTWTDINELNPLSKPVTGLGPKTQPYGVWARKTNAPIYLDIDDTLAGSLSSEVKIRVVWLDSNTGRIGVVYRDLDGNLQTYTIVKGDTGRWQEVTARLAARFDNGLSKGADLIINDGGDGADTLHMVEVMR